jgi:hypothetical protein
MYNQISDLEKGKFEESEGIAKSTVRVSIQDATNELLDIYACNVLGNTSPETDMSEEDKSVTVVSSAGAVAGDCINIREDGHLFQSIITSVVGNVVNFTSPCDKAFTTDAIVCFGEWNLATSNGSVTPMSFFVCPPENQQYDIVSISISMEDNSVMYDSTFGGLAKLTNGLIFRITNHRKKNLYLISNNVGFKEYGFVTEYPDKVPSGTYAFWADKNLRTSNGVVLRLKEGEKLEIINQDNLTGLIKFAVTVHGHLVKD